MKGDTAFMAVGYRARRVHIEFLGMILHREYVKVVKKYATNHQVKGLRVFRALRLGVQKMRAHWADG